MAALTSKDVTTAFARVGLEPFPGSPDSLAKYVASEIERWGRVIKGAGIQAE